MKASRLVPFARSVLLPVLMGLAAGIAGGMVGYAIVTAELQRIEPVDLGSRVRPVTTALLPETEIAKRLESLALPVFRKPDMPAAGRDDLALTADDAVGQAAALTSDGWLLTHASAAAGPVVIGIEGRFKEPRLRIDDPRTGLVFLKIDNGPLQVSGFEATEFLAPGTPLYAHDESRAFSQANYAGAVSVSGLRESERFSRAFRLDRDFGPKAAGGPVITASGSLAGILAPGGFVPVHLVRPVMSQAFRGQPIIRAELGVRYVDLSTSYLADGASGAAAGARLVRDRARGLPAVIPGSAAALSGLREGDVLLRLGDAPLTGGTDLAELVAEYAPGSSASVEFLRAGERMIATIAFR